MVDEDRARIDVEQPDALVCRVDDLSVSLVGAAGGPLDAVAADGDGGQVGRARDPGLLGGRRPARLAIVHRERAEHVAVGRR
jgi:hypothetical protein